MASVSGAICAIRIYELHGRGTGKDGKARPLTALSQQSLARSRVIKADYRVGAGTYGRRTYVGRAGRQGNTQTVIIQKDRNGGECKCDKFPQVDCEIGRETPV